jgi:antibiotic biosynthesis monooxygenase (ABM) superfamily enzyme
MIRPDRRPALSPPSIHVRAALTWLAIFPLVAVGVTVMAPLTAGWDPVLRAFVLTLVVVPPAVYLVVPWLMGSTTDLSGVADRICRGLLRE